MAATFDEEIVAEAGSAQTWPMWVAILCALFFVLKHVYPEDLTKYLQKLPFEVRSSTFEVVSLLCGGIDSAKTVVTRF